MNDPRLLTVRPEPGGTPESDRHITSTGSAHPLKDAFRISRLGLVHWLVRDHGFSELDAYQFATRSVEAPLAHVCDTATRAPAKIRKEWLPERETHRGGHARPRETAPAALRGSTPPTRKHCFLERHSPMEHVKPLPSRRRLLGGAALAAVPFALVPDAPARAQSRTGEDPAAARTGDHPSAARAVDYPAAEWQPATTSNYTTSSRPSAYPLTHVVIHVTQETYADTLAIFRNPQKKVSAHYVVRSADGHVAQCVREADIAWHAGNWDYNTRSIGIEHEGWVDRPAYFTDALYEQSARLTAAICAKYRIPRDRAHIIGHNEVPGADHTDPGPNWDWTRFMRLVDIA
jgi:hypothetical protein